MSDEPTPSIPPLIPSVDPLSPTVEPPSRTVEPVRPATSTPRRASSGRWLNLLLGLAAAVAIGGVAFAAGRGTAPAAAVGFPGAVTFEGDRTFPRASGAPGLGNGPGRGFALGGGITVDGTVQSVTADTLTITTNGGETLEISLDGDTAYHEQADATAADVAVGSDVSVQVEGGRTGQGTDGTTDGTPDAPALTASDVTVIP